MLQYLKNLKGGKCIFNSDFDNKLALMQSKGTVKYEKDKPLSECSTFKIGGPAAFFVYPRTQEGFIELLSLVKEYEKKYIVVGFASNLLFDDCGFDGVVISTLKMNGHEFNRNILISDAGTPISVLAAYAQKKALSGLEFAYGIPGTCGGAVFMNAGAYGSEIKDILLSSTYYDINSGEIVTIPLQKHNFDYRHSVYMESGNIILGAKFKLCEGDEAQIKETMTANMHSRIEKQPLEFPNAGSVFKRYPGYYTGKLIEECGLKGRGIGGAQVSEKHAGFIVNKGNATARDVLTLIEIIKSEIYKNYNIEIECEIRYVK